MAQSAKSLSLGSTEYLQIAASEPVDLTGDFTLEFWAKFNVDPNTNDIGFWDWWSGSSDRSSLCITSSNTLFARTSTDGSSYDQSSTPSLPALAVDTWYHLAFVYDQSAGTITMYYAEEGGSHSSITATSLSTTTLNTSTAAIKLLFEDGRVSVGKVHDLRLWRDVRSGAELDDNMETDSFDTTDLDLYMKFADNLNDETGDVTVTHSATPTYITDVPTWSSPPVITPSAQVVTVVAPSVTVAAGGSVLVTPSAQAVTVSQPAATVVAEQAVTVNASAQVVTVSIPEYSVTAGSGSSALATKSLDLASGGNVSIADASQTGLDLQSNGGDFTYQTFIKVDAHDANANILDKWLGTGNQRSYNIFFRETDIAVQISNDGNNPSVSSVAINHPLSISLDTWYSITIVFDASAQQVTYYMSEEDGTGGTPGTGGTEDNAVFDSTAPVTIGENFDGHLYETRIWNRALSASEVANKWNIGLDPASETDLVAYWKWEDDLVDETSNNNDLSDTGTVAYSTDIPTIDTSVTVNASAQVITVSLPSYTVIAPTEVTVTPSAQVVTVVVPTHGVVKEELVTPSVQVVTVSTPSASVITVGQPPTGLTATRVSAHSIFLEWTRGVGSNRTYIVMKAGSEPTDENDGVKVYNGTGESRLITHLSAETTYYFKAFGNSSAYSLATENNETTGDVPLRIYVTDQYIFIATKNGNGVEVRKKSAPGTIVATIAPSEMGGTDAVASVEARGNYLAFTAEEYFFLYEFVNESDYTKLLAVDVTNPQARSVHIDRELEYVYCGNNAGTITYYKLSDLTTQYTHSVGSDNIRNIDTYGDQMVVVSNDDKLYDIDRSDRTSMSNTVVNTYTGFNMESVAIDENYIYVGGDQQQVEVRNKTSPYAVVDTMTNPGNDVTSVRIADGEYISVSCDDTNVYIYDPADSFGLLSTITTPPTYAEDSWMEDGDLYYVSGGAATEKLYHRSYLTNTLTAGSVTASATTENEVIVSTQVVTVALPSATVISESPVVVTPSAQVVSVAVPAYTLNTAVAVTVNASVQVVTVSLPAVTKIGGVWTRRARQTDAIWSRRAYNNA